MRHHLNKAFLIGYFIIFHAIITLSGQDASFILESGNCVESTLQLTNNSLGSGRYSWDFCEGDLGLAPASSLNIPVSSASDYVGLEIIHDDDNWFGFLSRFGNLITRVSFGQTLDNSSPVTEALNFAPNPFSGSFKLSGLNENGSWVGLVSNFNGAITKLDFGSSFSNNPVASSISISPQVSGSRMIDVERDFGGFYGLMANSGGTVQLISFGNALGPSATSQQITVGGSPIGVKLFYESESGIWHGFVTTNNLIHLTFGNGLSSLPTSNEVLDLDMAITNGTNIEIERDAGSHIAIIGSTDGTVYSVDLGLDLSLNQGAVISASNLGVFSNVYGISGGKMGSEYRYFGANFTGNAMSKIDFPNPCESMVPWSVDSLPTTVSFTAPGSYPITLSVSGSTFPTSYHTEEVIISDQQAPDVTLVNSSICISQSTTLSVDSSSPLSSFSWDFDNDNIEDSNAETPIFSFPSEGDYVIRVVVDDGTCSNFIQQDITIYPEPPSPDFEINELLCGGAQLQMTNITADGAYSGPIEYSWDFNGEGTSTDRDPSFAFSGSGMKNISLTAGIPGCYTTIDYDFDLLQGPTSQYSVGSACQGEQLNFINESVNAVSYLWDFKDGFTSTQPNPTHIFQVGGNYDVELEVTDAQGCTNVFSQEIAIPSTPVADFDYDIPCTDGEGVAFYDLSQVTGSEIISWDWIVDGQSVSSDQNPLISFGEGGSKTVRLDVISANGCPHTIEQQVEVLVSPEVDFSSDLKCETLSSTFFDTTPDQMGVVSRIWSIDGQTYAGAEVNHVFTEAGQFDVTLTLTASNFCENTMTTSVTIPEMPILDFSLDSFCEGENILISDISIPGDPVVSRAWRYDGQLLANGPQAIIQDAQVGVHVVQLDVVTELGCEFQLQRNVEIVASPLAGFSASASYGVPPFTIDFTNLSQNISSSNWFVDGNLVATSTDLTQAFTTEGTFDVRLEVTNTDGCTQIEEIEVISAIPAINMLASNIQLTPQGKAQSVSLTVTNNGNLPIEIFDIVVNAGNDFSISERFNEFLGIGEQTTVQLSSAVQFLSTNAICVSIVSAYDDINPDDNEVCVNLTAQALLEQPFPNPFGDELTVRVMMNTSGSIQIQVANATGRLMANEAYQSLSEGLNILRYDARKWEKGLYFVTLIQGDHVVTRRVLRF